MDIDHVLWKCMPKTEFARNRFGVKIHINIDKLVENFCHISASLAWIINGPGTDLSTLCQAISVPLPIGRFGRLEQINIQYFLGNELENVVGKMSTICVNACWVLRVCKYEYENKPHLTANINMNGEIISDSTSARHWHKISYFEF